MKKLLTIVTLGIASTALAIPVTPATASKKEPSRTSQLSDALHDDDIKKVKELISAGLPINGKLEGATTPLMHAAERGAQHVVEYLLGQGADVTLVDKDGDNVLHWAAMGGEFEKPLEIIKRKNRYRTIVNLLINKGANKDAQAKDGTTPLMKAIDHVNPGVAEMLIEKGANPALQDKEGHGALWWAQQAVKIDDPIKDPEVSHQVHYIALLIEDALKNKTYETKD